MILFSPPFQMLLFVFDLIRFNRRLLLGSVLRQMISPNDHALSYPMRQAISI
jgi:hypothetical protein